MAVITTTNKIVGVTQGQSLSINSQHGVLAGDTDALGFPLSVSSVSLGTSSAVPITGSTTIQGTYGTLVMHADGSFSYSATPNIPLPADGVAQDIFTIAVTDSRGNTSQETLSIAVVRPGLQYVAGTPGSILTGTNNNTVYDASLGNQTVKTGEGNDVVLGGANDVITAGNGNNTILAGANNSITFGNGANTIVAAASDTITGGNGNNTVTAGRNDVVVLGNGNNTVIGGVNDSITLGNGRNTVVGAASDTIVVGNGQNTITVGTSDVVTVGTGIDTFIFTQTSASTIGQVTIAGFSAASDAIQFNTALLSSFAAVGAHAKQVGADTVITFDQSDSITLKKVSLSSLQSKNFVFVTTISQTVTIDPVEGNNVINYAAAHAATGVPLSGTVTGVAPNATFSITVTDGAFSKVYTATVNAAGTNWTAIIPSADAITLPNGTATVTAQISVAVQASQKITVAETLPTVSIDVIDNGLINAAAAGSGVALGGGVTGLAANSTFQLTLGDGSFSKSYTATVNGAGTGWTAAIPASDAITLADGTATVTAQVTDQYGNVSQQATRTVAVHETLPTVSIDVIDNGLINAAAAGSGVALGGGVTGLAANSTFQLTVGDGLFSKSYTATVNGAGTGWTATISASDAITLADGTATVTAQVTDQYGNVSQQAVRTVAVHETPPTVSIDVTDGGLINAAAAASGVALGGSVSGLAANSTFQLTVGDGLFSKSYTATVNGAGTGWTAAIPASDATTLADGTATVTAQVTDQYGNVSQQAVQTVAVHETLPMVSINVIDGGLFEATSPQGAAVTFAAVATDLVDGTDTVVFKEGNTVVHSGDTFSIGTHTITASATDSAGNASSETFTIKVQDTTPPVLSTIADQTEEATGPSGAVATFSATASDLVDGSDPVVFREGNTVVHSGDTFAIGTHTITASATDAAGNIGSETFSVRVESVGPPPPTIPVFDLSKTDQVGGVGSHQTQSQTVTLIGQTDAGDIVTLEATGQTTVANTAGVFQFTNVNLALGDNPLTTRATGPTGETSAYSLTIDRLQATASADAAVQWNQITLEAIKNGASDPEFASRALAMESLAVFDVVSAIDGTPGYLLNMSAPADADANAAVAQAAHDVLAYLYPGQKATFDTKLASALGAIADGQGKADGVALGASVAAKIIALRANDGWQTNVIDDGSSTVGQWRPTGPSFMPAQEPQWGHLTPFALTSPDQFQPAGPPDLTSQAYADAVNLTESLGAANSTTRTADQTQIAKYWNDGAGTYTPPGQWNDIAEQVAQAQGNSLAQDARLFAELNVAEADSAIAAWNTKYTYNTWRPVTVIQNADSFANAGIIQDPTWQSLIPNPPFPEYVSGHSTFSAAAADILTSFFGSDYTFSYTASSLGSLAGATRSFQSFEQAAQEAGMSRIYGGIHFTFSNTDGQTVGQQVGDWTLKAFDLSQDTVPPKIVLNQKSGLVSNQDPTITGIVTDNLSGVAVLQATLDQSSVMNVAFSADGTFSVPFNLALDGSADGQHTVTFSALDAAGNVATPLSFTFTLATEAPQITLATDSIQDGGTLCSAAHLTGTTALEAGDKLTSLTYSLDGGAIFPIAFDAGTRKFDQSLDLTKVSTGDHTLTLRAVDAAGNVTTDTLNVSLPSLPLLTIAALTPTLDASDVGVTYRPKITFSRPIDPSTLTSSSFFATDSTGTAVPATIVPFADNTGAWLFFTNPLPGASTITLHVQGDQIKGTDGTFLDAAGNGTAGSDLTETFTTVSTAAVSGTTISGIVVDPGIDGTPMTPDDVKAAADGLSDFANDTWKLPIAGVKVFVLGHEDQAVYTDAEGHFTLTNVPTGDVKVEFDGTSATNAPSGSYFPVMVMDTTIRPGVNNTIMGSMGSLQEQAANATNPAVYLPRLATDLLTPISTTDPTVVTVPADANMSGNALTPQQLSELTLTVQPGSLVDANGNPVGNAQVGISPVPPQLVQDMLPEGLLQHSFDITIQAPGGATFTTPAQLTMPNVFGLAPGEKTYILSFDHTTGRLVVDGTATASADGLTVTSDPDSGITAPGWHTMTPAGSNSRNQLMQLIRNRVRQQVQDKYGDYWEQVGEGQWIHHIPATGNTPQVSPFVPTHSATGTRGGLIASADFTSTTSQYLLEGAKWGGSNILGTPGGVVTYSFANGNIGNEPTPFTSELTSDYFDEIRAAFAQWSAVANITFQEVPDSVPSDIRIGWQNLSPSLLGQTAYQTQNHNFQQAWIGFNQNDTFVSNAAGHVLSDGSTTFEAIALHEIGHAIGLDQYNAASSIMNSAIDVSQIEPADVSEVQALYGLPNSPPPAELPSDTVVTVSFYYAIAVQGNVLRGKTDANGNMDVFLPPNQPFELTVFDPIANVVAKYTGTSSSSGQPTNFLDSFETEANGPALADGLTASAAYVIGVDPNIPDNLVPGITDLAALQQDLVGSKSLATNTGIVASLPLQGAAQAVALTGSVAAGSQTAFVATSYGLAIVDASNFQKPAILSQLNLAGDATDIAVDTKLNLAAVATGSGLQIVDFSDPTNPKLAENIGINATHVQVLDGIAYVNDGVLLDAFDLATGEELQRLGIGTSTITSVARDGTTLYTMDASNTLRVIDASNGFMVLESSLTLPYGGFAYSGNLSNRLFVANGTVYVPAGSNGFLGGYATVDVSNPNAPKLIEGPDATNIAGSAVALNGSGLGLLVGHPGGGFGSDVVDVVDAADPANTGQFITRYTLPSQPYDVAIGDGIAFVADGTSGLQVINYRSFDTLGIPPTITITQAPSDFDPTTPGIQAIEGQAVTIGATISDDVQVRNVEVLLNGSVVNNDVSYPWNLSVQLPTIAANGSDQVALQIEAIDTGGNISTTSPIMVQLVRDTTAPRLVGQSISEGGVVGQSNRSFVFDFSKALDPISITSSSFRLLGPGGETVVPQSIETRLNGKEVQVTYAPLASGNYQYVLAANQIQDTAGNILGSGELATDFTVQPFTVEWINPNGGNWTDTANWSTNKLPINLDDVFIALPLGSSIALPAAGTVVSRLVESGGGSLLLGSGSLAVLNEADIAGALTISNSAAFIANGTSAIGNLNQAGGTLEGGGNVRVLNAATFAPTFTNLIETGSGTTEVVTGGSFSNGILALDGGRTLQNDGTFNWTGGQFDLGYNPLGTTVGGASIINSIGATFNDAVAGAITINFGATVFTNAGTFATSFSNGTTTIGATFNNSGTVQLGAGSKLDLTAGGQSSGGTFTGAGALQFGSSYVIDAASTISAANVIIAARTSDTIDLAGTYTATNTTLSGGTVDTGSDAVSLGTNFTQTTGTLTGTGTVTMGTASFAVAFSTYMVESGSGTSELLTGGSFSNGVLALDGGRKLQNDGIFDWIGGQFDLGYDPFETSIGGSSIFNSIGATFNDAVAGSITANTGTNVFTNAGTFVTSFSSGTTGIGATFDNSGTVQLGAGSKLNLTAGGQSNGGTFTGAGTLQFGSNYLIDSASTISAANVIMAARTTDIINLAGTYTAANTTLSSGTVDAGSNAISLGTNFTQTAGTLSGTGTVTMGTASFAASSTYIVESGSGTTELLTGGSFDNGVLALDGGRTLQNDGIFDWTGGQFDLGYDPFETTIGGASIVNSIGATFNDAVAGSIAANTGSNVFTNAGTFVTGFSSGTTTIGVTFNDSGTVELGAGSKLSLTGGGTETGTFDVASSAVVQFSSAIVLDGATSSGLGELQLASSTLAINTTANLGSVFAQTGGTLAGTGTVTVTGAASFAASGTYMIETGSGTTDLKAGGELSNGILALDGGRQLQNDGTFNWTGGQFDLGYNPLGTTLGGASIVNSAGAIFNDAFAGSITIVSGTSVFTNAGTFITSFSSGATTIGVTFNNTGTVDAEGGLLSLSGGGTNSGIIKADGGNIKITSAMNDAGAAQIFGISQIEYDAASSENISFMAGSTGQLTLLHSVGFTGSISGFTGGGDGTPSLSDKLDLRDINFASSQFAKSYANNVLTVSDGSHFAHINMVGSYTLANFDFFSDGSGGTLVTDPPTTTSTQSSETGLLTADHTSTDVASIILGGANALSAAGASGSLTGTVADLTSGQASKPGSALGIDSIWVQSQNVGDLNAMDATYSAAGVSMLASITSTFTTANDGPAPGFDQQKKASLFPS